MFIKIKDSIKSSYSKYQDKLFHPQKTIENALIALRKLKPPILVKFKRIDYYDRLNIPVYMSEMKKEAKKSYPASEYFHHRFYGKGKDLIHSKASGLMELVERASWHIFFRNSNNFQIASFGKIKNNIALKTFLQPLQKNYRRDTFITNELMKAPLKCTRSFSLTKNKNILFPLDWFVIGSNGFAAGNSIEEAILQGLCEVVERHVSSTITEKKLITPLIDVNSIDNNVAKKIISKFNNAGIKLFIKDFSCGFEIPTIGILAYDSKGPKSVKIYCAAGTSLNKNIALIRALTEVAQHRSQVLFNKLTRSHTAGFPYYKKLKQAEYFINSERIIKFSDLPTYSNKNFKIEIETAVKKMKTKGFEVIVTNVTHPIIKIPTVVVTVLGARYIHGRNPYLELQRNYAEINNYYKSMSMLENFLRFYPSRKRKKELLLIYGSLYGSLYEKLTKFNYAIKIYKRISVLCGKGNKKVFIKTYKSLIRCYLKLKRVNEAAAICQKLKKLE